MRFIFCLFLATIHLVGEPAFAQEKITSLDMIPTASSEFSNCLIYHAIRADDQKSAIRLLVLAAKEECAIEHSIWSFFIKRHGEQIGRSEADTLSITAMAEKALVDKATTIANEIISA